MKVVSQMYKLTFAKKFAMEKHVTSEPFIRECDSYEYSVGGIILNKLDSTGNLEYIDFVSYQGFDTVRITDVSKGLETNSSPTLSSHSELF